MTESRNQQSQNHSTDRSEPSAKKKVFLVAAFHHPDPAAAGPVTGMAEDVLAVIGMEGAERQFAWVGVSCEDSIRYPAMVTPVKVRLAVPSPWHSPEEGIVTGLVQLAPAQLGSGTVEDDVDHLLTELATSREVPAGPERQIANR